MADEKRKLLKALKINRWYDDQTWGRKERKTKNK